MPIEGAKALFEILDISKEEQGKKDWSLPALMNENAARVRQSYGLKPSGLCLEKPYTIRLVGKGHRQRIASLSPRVAVSMGSCLCDNGLEIPESSCKPLFQYRKHEKPARTGISFILGKHIGQLREKVPDPVPVNSNARKVETPPLFLDTDDITVVYHKFPSALKSKKAGSLSIV